MTPLKRALQPAGRATALIKGEVPSEPTEGLYPGFSASGQDVWLRDAQFNLPGLVLSAVGARCGKVFEAPSAAWGTVANTVVLFPQPGYDSHFLWYLVNNENFWEKGGAAQPYVRVGETLQRRLPLPSQSQQRIIAEYLDAETARIDALITKKVRLMALLDERFEAAVFFSVTRGVAGQRSMKPSGLAWVKEMPADWGRPTVSVSYDLQLGKMLNAEAAQGTEQFAYVRNVNVQWDRFVLEDLATMHFDADDRRRCQLLVGDVLVCEGGEVGRAAVWDGALEECYFQKAIHRARPRSTNEVPRYLMYCLRAAAKQGVFSNEGNVSTIVHLTGEQLRVHRFPWPSSEEQGDIVAHLDHLSAHTQRATRAIGAQLDLLRERRQAIIAEAVAGRTEVRGAVA